MAHRQDDYIPLVPDRVIVTSSLPLAWTYLSVTGSIVALVAGFAAFSVLVTRWAESGNNAAFYQLFWVGEEQNIPTFVNFSLLAVASGIFALIALELMRHRGGWRWHWVALSGLLLLMAFDEAAQMHETLGALLPNSFPQTGIFRYGWVVFGLAFLSGVLVMSFRFWQALPRRARRMMLMGTGAFFGGAIGVEMIAAWIHDNGASGLRVATLIEESLEMLGAAMLGAAALAYAEENRAR